MDVQLRQQLAAVNRVVEDDSKPAFKDMVCNGSYSAQAATCEARARGGTCASEKFTRRPMCLELIAGCAADVQLPPQVQTGASNDSGVGAGSRVLLWPPPAPQVSRSKQR